MLSLRSFFASPARTTPRRPLPTVPTTLPVPAPACFDLDDRGAYPVCGAVRLAAFHADADLALLKDDGRPRVVFRDERAAFADTVFVLDLDRPWVRLTREGQIRFEAPVSRRLVVDVTSADSVRVTLDPPAPAAPLPAAPAVTDDADDLPWMRPFPLGGEGFPSLDD